MFWTVTGANAIIALRGCLLDGRFENYWELPHSAWRVAFVSRTHVFPPRRREFALTNRYTEHS
jgi:hypothetical protein